MKQHIGHTHAEAEDADQNDHQENHIDLHVIRLDHGRNKHKNSIDQHDTTQSKPSKQRTNRLVFVLSTATASYQQEEHCPEPDQEEVQVVNPGNADRLLQSHPRFAPTVGYPTVSPNNDSEIDGHGKEAKHPVDSSPKRQPEQLCGDDEEEEAEDKHGPQFCAQLIRPARLSSHNTAVSGHPHFQEETPVLVEMHWGVGEAGLDEDEVSVAESHDVTSGVLHGVVPECVDGRPGKSVPVVSVETRITNSGIQS